MRYVYDPRTNSAHDVRYIYESWTGKGLKKRNKQQQICITENLEGDKKKKFLLI